MDRLPQLCGTHRDASLECVGFQEQVGTGKRTSRLGEGLGGQQRRAGFVSARGLQALGLAVAIVSLSAVLARRAWAQSAAMGLPALTQERGLRTGEFVLYPSFGLMGHYDSNLFNGSDKEKGNLPVGATSLRFLPRLALVNDPTSNVSFSFVGAGDARLYMADDEAVKAQQNVGGNVNLDVTFGQRRAISFTLFDYFNRTLRANNWETSVNLNRVANDVGARVEFHPGDIPERRPFNVALAGSYAFDWFDNFVSGNTATIRTKLAGSWRFLPKTAAILDATWDFRTYDTQELRTAGLAADSKPFRAKVGVSGALTKRISAQALAGWGLSAHAAGSEFNSFLASVGVGLRASESTRLYVAYDRDYADSFFANYVGYHRFSLTLRQRFGSVLDVSGGFGLRLMSFGLLDKPKENVQISGIKSCTGSVSGQSGCRQDTSMDGNLLASFDLHRLVGMNVGYTLRKVVTGFQITAKGNSALVLDAGEYTAHEIFASLVVRY